MWLSVSQKPTLPIAGVAMTQALATLTTSAVRAGIVYMLVQRHGRARSKCRHGADGAENGVGHGDVGQGDVAGVLHGEVVGDEVTLPGLGGAGLADVEAGGDHVHRGGGGVGHHSRPPAAFPGRWPCWSCRPRGSPSTSTSTSPLRVEEAVPVGVAAGAREPTARTALVVGEGDVRQRGLTRVGDGVGVGDGPAGGHRRGGRRLLHVDPGRQLVVVERAVDRVERPDVEFLAVGDRRARRVAIEEAARADQPRSRAVGSRSDRSPGSAPSPSRRSACPRHWWRRRTACRPGRRSASPARAARRGASG